MASLNAAYFDYHPDKLLQLREWLPSNRNINLNDRTMCILIRHGALGLTSKRNEHQDLSIGLYLQEVYVLHICLFFLFFSINQREGYTMNIQFISFGQAKRVLSFLFSNLKRADPKITLFQRLCRKSNAVSAAISQLLPNTFSPELIQELQKTTYVASCKYL